MSYYRERFTYGRKTTAQINALVGMQQGDTVWNTDIKKREYYNGSLWINDDCVVFTNGEAVTVGEGKLVYLTNTTNTVMLADNVDNDFFIGVVFRGAAAGGSMVVAIKGVYKVEFNPAALPNIGDFANLTANANLGYANVSATGTVNTIGLVAENYSGGLPVDRLVKCWIQSHESY